MDTESDQAPHGGYPAAGRAVERRSGGGSPVLEHLLDEQVAYYRALGADDVTEVDASPEMLAIAATRVFGERVRFIRAGLFTWRPDRRYDIPQGRVFFADDAYRTPDELVEGPSSSTIRRKIPDGTAYRIVKVPHQPGDLERLLQQLGWDIKVTATAGPCYWGAGSLA